MNENGEHDDLLGVAGASVVDNRLNRTSFTAIDLPTVSMRQEDYAPEGEMKSSEARDSDYGPWNPGIESSLPRHLLPLSTLFRPENTYTHVEDAFELHEFTGIEPEELVVFRPERLVLHELLVRVTANLSVPDGPRIEDLGINFRAMIDRILAGYIEPHMSGIVRAYDGWRRELATLIDAELAGAFAAHAACASAQAEAKIDQLLAAWQARARSDAGTLPPAAFRALVWVISAVRIKHGRLWGAPTLLAPVATGIACNEYGSVAIGRSIEPHIAEAVLHEHFSRLPAQPQPVVMNTKGAPASGKSSMRPMQKMLAAELGVNWNDFALISPDIWRKQLLDYGALGAEYKYAGAFTGQELQMIDKKLDRYMADKAERREMSHLLIDRFRFDSFAPQSDEAGSNLLTRFGHRLYLFFMITPPDATVERSWRRGLEVGRYKAVDDVLAHNVEAYTGMPDLFFTWALRADKLVHYEFLDNSVPAGERPRTVAFGWDGELNVLDVKCMLDIVRYGKIDISARAPDEVYRDREAMAAVNNTGFLLQCARRLPTLNFASRDSGRIYASLEAGTLVWTDPEALAAALEDPEIRTGLLAVAPNALDGSKLGSGPGRTVDRRHTLGR